MEDFKRSIKIGTKHSGNGGYLPVYVEIEYKGGRLSLHGHIGQRQWGQIQDNLVGKHANWSKLTEGWNYKRLHQLVRAWERWHLNDMRSGTPDQMFVVRQLADIPKYPMSYYEFMCEMLDQIGLYRDEHYTAKGQPMDPTEYEDSVRLRDRLRAEHEEDFVWGYKYGHGWLREDVPEEVVRWLKECPNGGDLVIWEGVA